MICFRKLPTVFGAALIATSVASSASAGPAYNCKSDRRLDVPMQFSAVIESNGRVHLSASGGSDKSGWVAPYNNGAWRVLNAANVLVTRFTDSLFLFASTDLLKETYVEGLLPGTYTIELTSTDLCGNRGKNQRSITIGQPALEATPPVISAPQLTLVGGYLGATSYSLYFTATDDTGIKRLTVEVNGHPIVEYNYFNGTSYRWWTAFYPEDSTLTAFEGPGFYVSYPAEYKGLCGVQVTGEDVHGNLFTATGSFCLP
jgi:hypothetical protein